MDFLHDFTAEMAAHGFKPKGGTVKADDKWHQAYYGNERGAKCTGAYTLKQVDGEFAIGCFFTRKDPDNKYNWHSKGKEKLSTEERARIKRQIEAEERKRQAAEAHKHARIATFLTAYYTGGIAHGFNFKKLPKVETHKYLEKKKVGAHGVKFRAKGKELIVPLYGIDGKVWTVQRITPTGKKFLFPGGRKKGSYFPFAKADDNFSIILVCEGFSTGASIRQATNLPTVMAVDSGNLKPVLENLKKKFPKSRFVICADNDAYTKNASGEPWNVGKEKAEQAAASIGGASVVLPTFLDNSEDKKYSDFNDLHAAEGLETVTAQIMAVVQAIPPVQAGEVVRGADETPSSSDMHPPADDYYHEPDFSGFDPIQLKQGDFEMNFKCLGFKDGLYYYFSYLERRIVALTAAGHTLQNLLQLDTLEAWESSQFGLAAKSEKKIGLYAFNAMREVCAARGRFNEEDTVRGGGAWIDTKRIVVNAGDRLYVDGKPVDYDEFKGENTYVSSAKFMRPQVEPLTNNEANALRKICEMVTWDNKLSGSLLAGWLVIAPVCGALDYRPHLWITGEAESGKSTVIKKIVRRVLGKMALNAEKGTTEASIRQRTGQDARPLVYDEAEPGAATEGAIELARLASTGGTVSKFGQGTMSIRFAACFSSINPPVDKMADESRISFLHIKKNRKPTAIEDYNRLVDMIETHLTHDFGDRLTARVVKHLDVLFANIQTFQTAARRVIRGARASEQIGTMIAGLYMLHSTDLATAAFAEEWLNKYDWRDHTAVDEDGDPTRLLQHLAGCIIDYRVGGNPRESTLGDIIVAAHTGGKGCDEDKALRLYGIKVQDGRVYIASRSQNLKKLLNGTDWSKRWSNGLCNLDGSVSHKVEYFTSGVKTSAVSLPIEMFTDKTQEIEF